MKKITLLLILLCLSLSINAQTYLTENFDTSIPATWTIDDAGSTTGDSWISAMQGGGNSLDGTNGAIADSDANGNGELLLETLTTPVFDTSGATALFLDFSQYYNNIGTDSAIVEVWDGTAWVAILTQTANAGSFATPDQQHIDITAYSNAAMQVRFIYNDNNVWAWYWMIDNVIIYNASCPNPTALTSNSIGATTADISWTAGGTETDWEIVVQAAGSGTPTSSGTPVTTNPTYQATGLSPVTDYDVYIRANCGGDFSIWVGPISFTTECAAFTPDYIEDFATIPASCWDEADNGDATTGPLDIGNGGWNQDGFLNNGFQGAYSINLWQSIKSDWLLSPMFDLTGVPFQVEFDFGVMDFGSSTTPGTLGSDDIVQFLITTDLGATWTVLETWDTNTVFPLAGLHPVYDLTTYTGQTVQFALLGSEGTVDDTADIEASVDNFQVRAIPACSEPLMLAVTNVTDTTADFSWTSNNGETQWEYVIQPAGTGIPTGAGTPTTTNPLLETALSPSTAYEFYILADCGTEQSQYSGPINFTTLNTPPPAPTGVTCTTGTSSTIFTETFGDTQNVDPAGWTGTGFGGTNGNWRITNPGGNSGGTGPANSFDGNAGVHLEYEASGNASTIASAISPAIDLTAAADGAELAFFMHAFGGDIGTLNVNVGTSATGPFTTEYTWIGDYQSTDAEAWVPIGINLDAYLGQVIYLEFSYGATGNDWEGDMALDQITVETCGSFCIAPSNIAAANITDTTADISWTANSGETQWEYVIQPAGTGTPTGPGTVTNTPGFMASGLSGLAAYEVYVLADCGGSQSVWAGPYNFNTDVQLNFTVDCSVGPQNINYCYDANDTNVFTFTSTDGSALNFTINSGNVENNWDELIVLDSDGITDLNILTPYGNTGDVSGITYQSSGDTISFQITSDGSVSCQSSTTINPLDITVSCATCVNPTATYQVVDDCDNGDQFLVDVNITSIGDATSVSIEDNQGNPAVSVTTAGTTQFGPYPFNTDVIFTVSNNQDVNCIITSSAFNIPTCPPANDNCENATEVVANADGNCTNFVSGTLFGATASAQTNPCTGTADDDVWFSFTALGTDHAISFSNIAGPTTFLSHGIYEGPDCDNLTNLYCSTADESIANGLIPGNTYYIRVFTFNDTPYQDVTFDLCVYSIPPPITTDVTQYTLTELVEDILVNSPCSTISNVTSSSGSDFGTDTGIGYFEANGSGFPFESGIIMTTGNALNAPGPETGNLSDGGFPATWPGDTDLEAVINEGPTNNASVIEFDFVPFIEDMSFEFIFAAEEYGTFQCGFSDAFAFLLTDTVTGVTTNIAVVPGTTTPVSVFTIRDDAYNASCPSANPELFDAYYGNGGQPALTNPTNFIGRTVPLTAMSTVIPNRIYHIKLVIADDGDTAYDSAVFLKAGSFEIGEVDLGDDILLANGNANCEGDEVTLDVGVPVGDNATITWYTIDEFLIQEPVLDENGVPESGLTLDVTESNTYQVEIVLNSSASCYVIDNIIVEFFPNPIANPAQDILGCDDDDDGLSEYDLTTNDAIIIGSQTDVTVTYHETEQDAIDGVNAIPNPTDYISSALTIYYRIGNGTTNCAKNGSFNLTFGTSPETSFDTSVVYEVCPNASAPITVTATADNYTESEVTITWYNEGVLVSGQTDLSIDNVLTAGTYTIEVMFNATGCTSTEDITVYELETCVIPQGISPNGDGLNDTFDLSSFDVQRLTIFNRNGVKVYEKTNYTNEWHGQSLDGDELPVGTYYYVMDYQGNKNKAAWVYINRENK
ncbi:choice-of-anchor L domain-containing protein [Lacinutrix algicola]|uniref:choice-of-anchor L domain-containing protein n=1 Tax=Lacinutrix algicola TaxID=342954 RepID=UPI0006E43FD0|nr:choice-of-anchor L domain-containing protein [Lacinutrix algicola]